MKKLLLILVLLFPLVVSAKTLVIFHTSDTHGFFYPQNKIGGFAALKSVINHEKKPFLLLDSGDFANGTAEAKFSRGAKAVQLMNAVGYSAVTIGNHEFDFKDAGITALIQESKFSILAANLREKATGLLPAGVQAARVFNVDGIKVAVIGLANNHPSQPTQKYTFIKPLTALSKALQEVEKQDPAVLIVIVHDSFVDYQHDILPYMGQIAKRFPGRVQVVLGGHAHKIVNEYLESTLYVESGAHLEAVSKITVNVDDETGKFLSAQAKLISLNVDEVGQDKTVAKLAEELREPGLDNEVAVITKRLSKKPILPNTLDGELDDWLADEGRKITKTEIFIHNTGGTRMDLLPGSLTRRQLIDLFPFNDVLISMEVPGYTLKKFIKSGLVPWNKYTYSGITVSFDKIGPNRVKNLQIKINGKPLEKRQIYRVGTNSYIARQALFTDLPQKQVGNQKVSQLIEQALSSGELFTPQTGRITYRQK
ncbi:5'-nucleotidase C-terminal domain-containing protein [Candidatus Avelusimicrobium fimicolum]|uniref:bifunctional metallophosphatase/5'-nucleotidase n=1 Tax=Candidatus Avelusimicrobium fimicolum TaxID=3416216 RepID=UPI0015B0CA6C